MPAKLGICLVGFLHSLVRSLTNSVSYTDKCQMKKLSVFPSCVSPIGCFSVGFTQTFFEVLYTDKCQMNKLSVFPLYVSTTEYFSLGFTQTFFEGLYTDERQMKKL